MYEHDEYTMSEGIKANLLVCEQGINFKELLKNEFKENKWYKFRNTGKITEIMDEIRINPKRVIKETEVMEMFNMPPLGSTVVFKTRRGRYKLVTNWHPKTFMHRSEWHSFVSWKMIEL